MQRPIDSLRAEHAVTDGALAALDAIGDHVGEHRGFPAADVATLLRFLRESVLAAHVRKEAEVVWPSVALRADDATAAVIGDLFRLQADVQDLMHSLVLFWEPVDDLSAAEQDGFAATVAAFTARLRRMQRTEEAAVFAVCDAVPADDQIDWVNRFRDIDAGRVDSTEWQKRLAPIVRRWTA